MRRANVTLARFGRMPAFTYGSSSHFKRFLTLTTSCVAIRYAVAA
jgi:hypothetical protein